MIECTFEGGKVANLRHAVVDGLMIKDGKVLLTKRAATLTHGGKWAIPGGYIDRDESTVEAVMREVLEETGYTCEVEGLLTVRDQPNRGDDRQNISFVFTVKPIAEVGKPDSKEVSELKWFSLEALPDVKDMAFDHLEIIWEWIKQNDPLLKPE